MSRFILVVEILCLALTCFAGFKPKIVKAKKPEQFQAQASISEVRIGADLILEGKEQREFFYKELAPSGIIAIRLAIFNYSKDEILIPLLGIQLIGPDGNVVRMISPNLVSEAVLQGFIASSKLERTPVIIESGVDHTGSSRTDRTDPNYDPRLDPTGPGYDPSDPRNTGYDRPSSRTRPGIVVLPGGGGVSSDITRSLIEKDFSDKSYIADPIPSSMTRDKFLFFSLDRRPGSGKGFELRLPSGRGVPRPVTLRF